MNDDEKPRHAVTLTRAYYLDETEVTVGMWRKYVGEGGGTLPSRLRSETTDAHPIHHVSWSDAQRYGTWAHAALPTEAQWERAAKGGHDDFVYPWGIADDVNKRNAAGAADGFDGLAPVRSFAPNDFGLYDMGGNIWEWCADWYDATYYAVTPNHDPTGPASGVARAVHGGQWIGSDDVLRASFRYSADPATPGDLLGFRLARSLP